MDGHRDRLSLGRETLWSQPKRQVKLTALLI